MRILAPILLVFLLFTNGAYAGGLEDGKAAYDRNNFKTAFTLLKPLAEQGSAKAQFEIGLMYAGGDGVEEDHAKALKWMQKSADQGNAKAKLAIGLIYASGQGVKRNWTEAHRWYQEAMKDFLAYQNTREAQINIGGMYLLELGVSPFYKAYDWLEKAATQNPNIEKGMVGLDPSAKAGYVVQDDDTLNWMQMAATLGYYDAQDMLASTYMDNKSGKQNYAEAFKWYWKRADQGDAWSEFKISTMYSKGQGVKKDLTEASKWLRKSAEQGRGEAQKILAESYRTGSNGFPKDYVEAYFWRSLYTRTNAFKVDVLHACCPSQLEVEPSPSVVAAYIAEYELGMTAKQIAEAKRLVSKWRPASSPPDPRDPARPKYAPG